MTRVYTDSELEAYLDEALSVPDMADVEAATEGPYAHIEVPAACGTEIVWLAWQVAPGGD